jgi:thiopeptide-type bacteriocin biosynthesis protein
VQVATEFVMRIPALPVSAFDIAWSAESAQELLVLLPKLAAAVSVASPSLYDACTGRLGDSALVDALPALRRYAARMATRPTPFGLFAGVATGRFADATGVQIDKGWRIRARPDMGRLYRLIDRLETDPDIFKALRVQANPATLLVGGRAAVPDCAELTPLPNAATRATSVRATRLVRVALALTAKIRPVSEVVSMLRELSGVDEQRALKLLSELRDSSILLTDLRPPLTTSDPLGHVLAALNRADINLAGLHEVRLALDSLGAGGAWPNAAAIAEANARVVELTKGRDNPDAASVLPAALHLDLAFNVTNPMLPNAVAEATADAAMTLLHWATGGEHDALRTRLQHELHRAYGEAESVSIGELWARGLLDAALTDDGRIPGVSHTARNERLLALAVDAAINRRSSVELDQALLEDLAGKAPAADDLPATMEIFVSVAAASESDIDAGRFTLIIGPGTGSQAAGRSTGRFDGLLESTGRPARDDVDTISAELVTMPRDPRLANVVVRDAVGGYEIALGVPPSPGVACIPLRELELGTARDGALGLWWSATGQRVLVTHRSMLNPQWAAPIARVLLAAGNDARRGLGAFSWGAAEVAPYLPRVTRARSVLRPAQWRLDTRAGEAAAMSTLDELRTDRGLPQRVSIGEGDQVLLLDLGSPAGMAELRRAIRTRNDQSSIVVREALPCPTDAWLRGPDGRHLVELAVRLSPRGDLSPARPERRSSVSPATGVGRLRPPGSEWTYIRIPARDDAQVPLLLGPVSELIDDPELRALVDLWFFVRYRDPAPHLRLRFHALDASRGPEVLARLARWAGANKLDAASFEPYAREVTRYGGPEWLEQSEAVFCADSLATLALLRSAREAPSDMLAVGAASLRGLCRAAGLDDDRLVDWIPAELDAQAGVAFRTRKLGLREALAFRGDGTTSSPTQRRDELIAATCDRLGPMGDDWERERVVRSWAHLHANRLFGPDLATERLVLGLLRRTLRSLAAQPAISARIASSPVRGGATIHEA